MKRDLGLSTATKWAIVIGLTILHPLLLYLLIPAFGEPSNMVSVIAPIAATLLFNWRIGMVLTVLNVVVTARTFMLLTTMGAAEGRPKAVASGVVIALLCFGAEKFRLYVAKRSLIEEELNRAKKMEAVGRLAGGVAHDINNTLNAVTASLFALRKELGADAGRFADLDNIAAACDRGAQLTRNLLGFARKSNYKRQTISLNEVVESVYALLRRTANKNIRFDIRLDATRPLMIGDRGQIESAVMNLCINALDAMGEEGILTVSTGADENRAIICVEDTGVGMDAKVRERVFEPFFTTKAEGKGTGLGLAMVYGVVHAMSGRIELDTAPGKGTAVTLSFPRITAAVAQVGLSTVPPPPVSESPCLSGRTVLLIDDEPLVLRSASRMLKTLGCEVTGAGSGSAGVMLFEEKKETVDLVIVDLIMPEMDGIAVIEQLKKIRSSIPIILVSGYTRESERLESITERYEAVRFLTKPYRPEALIIAAEELLGCGSPRGSNRGFDDQTPVETKSESGSQTRRSAIPLPTDMKNGVT